MAKLKARGRIELFRVEKETDLVPTDASGLVWKKDSRALMSDGNILERTAGKWPDKYEGVRHHDWGWKVRGKIKAGWTPQKLLDFYLAKGFVLKNKVSLLTPGPLFDEPLVTEAKASQVKKTREKAAVRRAVMQATKHGAGFYITNVYTGGSHGKRAAELGPYQDFAEAENAAVERLRDFIESRFDYLLPVQIIESSSRHDAEHSVGHVWWADGKFKGPPADPRQLRFAGVNGRT